MVNNLSELCRRKGATLSKIWSALGFAKLQALIGIDLLERLETLLPILQSNGLDYNYIYSRDGLCKIFDAFGSASAMEKTEFRREFFNSLPEATIDRLIEAADLGSTEIPFGSKVEKLVKRGWRSRDFGLRIAQTLGLSEDLVPMEYSAPPIEVQLEPATTLYKPLKDYQFSVYAESIERLTIPLSRFMVQMPTGSGKTRTAIEILCTFLNEAPPGAICIWLVHAEELCDQAYSSFAEVWPHVGQHRLSLYRCWGGSAQLPYRSEARGFLVASFQSLHALLQRDAVLFEQYRPAVKVIVVDEAHRLLAPSYKEVTAALMGSDTRIVGLTATPGRSALDDSQNEALATYFFNQIVTIDAKGKGVLEYLRSKQVLAQTSYVPLLTDRNYEMNPQQLDYMARFFDFPPSLLSTIGRDDVRNLEILRRLEYECSSGSRVIFFGCSVEHSRFICAMLILLGVKAAHVDSTIPKARRKSIIREFKNERVQVVCNFGILSTGFDAPMTDVVFIARPTSSIVLYSQMIGRGLRGPAIGGTETCRVIDVRDNIAGYSNEQFVYEYFTDYYH
jgi:DNA repair protein RadD